MNTRELTNGRDRSKGWTQNAEGNWIPSAFDRRRVAVATMNMVAENNGGQLYGPVIAQILTANSTDLEDFKVLADNFNKWMASQQA